MARAFLSTEEVHLKAGPAHHGVARLLSQPEDARRIDAYEVAPPLPRLAGNEHAVDISRVHEIHDRAWRIVERPDIEPVGLEHDDVGFLSGGERADLALEACAASASDRGELEHLPAGQQRRQVLLAVARALEDEQTLEGEGRPHDRKEVL